MKITIEVSKENENLFDVTLEEHNKESKLADRLGYDEMLGLITSITMPEKRPCLQWLKTEEERKKYEDYMKELRTNKDK